MTPRHSRVAAEVFAAVPSYQRVVVTCTVPDGLGDPSRAAQEVRSAAATVADSLGDRPVTELAAVAHWRSAFKSLDINPGKFRPALEALVRRAAAGGAPVLGSLMIDLGTAVSLRSMCPVGVHTVDLLENDLELRAARGDETFETFTGEIEHPAPGEIVYVVGSTVLTRRWAWRQGSAGSVVPGLTRFAINVDALSPTERDGALAHLLEALEAHGVRDARSATISSTMPCQELRWADRP